MKLWNFTIVCLATVFSLWINFTLVTSSKVGEKNEEYNYIEGSEKGPEHWGQLHKEWKACGKGNMQSPIDLLDKKVEVVPGLGKHRKSYKPSNATLVNRGHDLMLKWANGGGVIYINETKYVLKQIHWHTPAEHTLGGARYILEAHLVHQSIDSRIAVVGILYKIGRHEPFLSKLMPSIHTIADKEGAEREMGIIDPLEIKLGSRKYYRYMGSLTTPPCTEGVIWTIVRKVRTVSRLQVRLLRMAVHGENFGENSRPTQATNERKVLLYRPLKV